MKYLLTIIMALFIMSCTEPTYDNTVSELTVTKSVDILSQSIDSLTIVRDGEIIYELNAENKVVAQYQLRNHNSVSYKMTIGDIIFGIMIGIVIGIVIGTYIFL